MTENEGLWPLCETCGAVPTRHNDYKDCEKHLQVVARAYEAGRENGIKQERASVVAWLRAPGTCCDNEVLADDIDNGEHRREEKPGAIVDVPRACE